MVKKEKKQIGGTIFTFVIAFIMIFSVVGYIGLENQTSQFKYHGLKFTQDATYGGWSTTINKKQVKFDYFPSDVELIELSPEIVSFISGKPEIDATSSVNDTFAEDIALAEYNMGIALNKLNLYFRYGFTANNTFNLPIITCEDATYSTPVIYFMQSNETRITMQDNCIIAEARNNIDILRLKDRLLYSILGVIR